MACVRGWGWRMMVSSRPRIRPKKLERLSMVWIGGRFCFRLWVRGTKMKAVMLYGWGL